MPQLIPIMNSKEPQKAIKKRYEPFGRPTKYNPEFTQYVERYLLTVGREATKLPTRVELAYLLNVTEDTLNIWALEHKDFLGALSRVDQLQKAQLMNDGLYGGKEVNPRMAQFLLNVNHHMVEKTAQDITSGGQKLEPTKILIVEESREKIEARDENTNTMTTTEDTNRESNS